ncbi:hypothetical protein B0H10DRAFT_2214651 [Mycena sp. CBHHK59/15]|nr:hypothetical protein B0H10DRAFT_2214651 [Mycena sp. CBHHK59/15]
MFFTKLFTVFPIFTAVIAGAFPSNLTVGAPSPNLVSIAPMGNIATVQTTSGDTRLFFQDSTGAILEWNLSGPFTTGKNVGHIAVGNPTYTGVRLYFLSPSYVLSEYIWPTTISVNTNGFMGGPSCTTCLTTQGIVVSSSTGSKVLYAMANPAFNQFRVGFVSAGQPTTLSETENFCAGWQVNTYPN